MMKENLKRKQEEINALYEKEGLTDEVLDKQIALNRAKTAHNIAIKNNKYIQ